jgi:hypothetical protein
METGEGEIAVDLRNSFGFQTENPWFSPPIVEDGNKQVLIMVNFQ